MLTENDLFPTGSINLESLENMGRMTDDNILACAAALTDAAGLSLGRMLTDVVRERGRRDAGSAQCAGGGRRPDRPDRH